MADRPTGANSLRPTLYFLPVFLLVFLPLVACEPGGLQPPLGKEPDLPLGLSTALDQDGDGFTADVDCLDSGYLQADKGAPPCNEEANLWFTPSDGQDAKDFSIIERNGEMHLFHIRRMGDWGTGDNETTFGHESSANWKSWTYHPPLDLRGAAGSWNAKNIWAPNIIEEAGEYWMFYTGVNYGADRAENLQRIGLSKSTDLMSWAPSTTTCDTIPGTGCLFDCSASFTRWGSGDDFSGDCRDPWVVPYQNGWLMVMSTSWSGSGGGWCLALAQSNDLLNWTLIGELPHSIGAKAESPVLFQRQGVWTLFWTADAGIHMATAADPLGQWSNHGYQHIGFANELMPLEDDSWLFPLVLGSAIRFERLLMPVFNQTTFSLNVLPECRVLAADINPSSDDPFNLIDDNCDGLIDAIKPPPPPQPDYANWKTKLNMKIEMAPDRRR